MLIGAWLLGAPARAAPEASSAAQDIYASAPPRLLQIRTLVADAGRQTSIGSGFLVSADGLAVTNYHVVEAALSSQFHQLLRRHRCVRRIRPAHRRDPDHHSYVRTVDLNQFQLAAVLTQQSQPRLVGGGPFRKWYTPERCHEDFVRAAPGAEHPPLRVIWCAQGYRPFEGLYDIVLTAVTQDHGSEALVSRLSLQAVGYDAAMSIGKRFLEAVQVAK